MPMFGLRFPLFLCLLGLGGVLTTVSPVFAQSERYNEAKAKAKEAFAAGDFNEAALLFREAFDIEPRGNLLYNIGLCYEKSGSTTDAVVFYQRFVDAVPGSPKRPALQQKIAELKTSLEGEFEDVTVNTSPAGAVIFVDEKAKGAMGTSPVTFRLLPGNHLIIAELEGHEPAKKQLDLVKGRKANVQLQMLPSGSVGGMTLLISERGADVMVDGKRVGRTPLTKPVRLGAGSHEVMVIKPGFAPWKQMVEVQAGGETKVKVSLATEGEGGLASDSGGGSGNIWPWVTMGLGVAAVGGGIYTGLSAQNLYDQLTTKKEKGDPIAPQDIDTGNSFTLYTNVLFGVGGALIVGGVVWWMMDDSGVDTSGSVQASVGMNPDGSAAVAIKGTF